MFMTDPIADMLTRIRNAQAVKKKTVLIPYSKIKLEILDVLLDNGFIEGLEKVKRRAKNNRGTSQKFIEVILKYDKKGQPRISEIKRVSKPSKRVFVKEKDIWPFKKGLGLKILSTSKGILSDLEAKKLKLGGEVLLEIW
ncbi:MAG: 30S ribosomal protein S8 [Candidatus Pacebacteria bacterium]|nr:30S ribosomal protein S8 [Candidatus Paceibacterota bacterium]